MKRRIFISSTQRDLARERKAIVKAVANDPQLSRFFSTFAFEFDVPVQDKRTDEVYLTELAVSDIYVCIVGDAYGSVTPEGVSATECEYDEATRLGLPRFVFVKGLKDTSRDPRQTAFLNKVSTGLVRSRFATIKQLLSSLTTTLDAYLVENKTVMRPVFDEKGHQVGQKTAEVGQKPITNRSEPITNRSEPITNQTQPITNVRLELPDDFDQRMAANRKDLRERAKRIWLRIAHDADVTVRDLASECGFSIASTQGALNALRECGLLEKTGSTRNGKWRAVIEKRKGGDK